MNLSEFEKVLEKYLNTLRDFVETDEIIEDLKRVYLSLKEELK